ncbi:MAG TPA: hypothetical protein VFT47_14160 [Vicinamibacterales bacterium]|nr:hypothetical protein [Vicinamibacterales bacterium]
MTRIDDPFRDGSDLRRGLSLPENHLREALPGVSVVIDAGEPEVLKRLLAQNLKELFLRRLRSKGAGANGLEKGPQLLTVHRVDFEAS